MLHSPPAPRLRGKLPGLLHVLPRETPPSDTPSGRAHTTPADHDSNPRAVPPPPRSAGWRQASKGRRWFTVSSRRGTRSLYS